MYRYISSNLLFNKNFFLGLKNHTLHNKNCIYYSFKRNVYQKTKESTLIKSKSLLVKHEDGIQYISEELHHTLGSVKELSSLSKDSDEDTVKTSFFKSITKFIEQHYNGKNNIFNIQSIKFDIYFKELGDKWICQYKFNQPECQAIEGISETKIQAAQEATTKSLQWLQNKIKNSIEDCENKILDQNSLNNIDYTYDVTSKNIFNKQLQNKINEIYEEFTTKIKPIFEDNFTDLETKSNFNEEQNVLNKTVHKPEHPVYGKRLKPVSHHNIEKRNEALKKTFEKYAEHLSPLPFDKYSSDLVSALERSRCVLVVGGTGCGKSTRAPAAVLRHFGGDASVIVTQPRRLAAIGLAERVAYELGEPVGETVGYQVRFDAVPPKPPCGSVLFCTTGVLLSRLKSNPGLEGCTHVIIDEVHERDINIDMVLLLLRKAALLNSQLKLIIMSATIDTDIFTRYFGSCSIIEVPGKIHPVKTLHLTEIVKKYDINLDRFRKQCDVSAQPMITSKHCKEVAAMIKMIDFTQPEGAILVFLPGKSEIRKVKEIIDTDEYFTNKSLTVLQAHSSISKEDQLKIFIEPPPGWRKIILATNIAETSITIPDVVYVVDSGLCKQKIQRLNSDFFSLDTTWISEAAAKQRAGRAGRTKPGFCFRLYTKEQESLLNKYTTPEVLRLPLVETVLNCKSYAPNEKAEDFLATLLEPPNVEAIQHAVRDLVVLGALTPSERLTNLGAWLCKIPAHPRLSTCLLFGAICGCVKTMADIVAMMQYDVFAYSHNRKSEIRDFRRSLDSTSDHLAMKKILQNAEEVYDNSAENSADSAVDQYCEKYGLDRSRLSWVETLSDSYTEDILASGIIDSSDSSDDVTCAPDLNEVAKAILYCGSDSLLLKTYKKRNKEFRMITSQGETAHISASSVNHDEITTGGPQLYTYFNGYHIGNMKGMFVDENTAISPIAVLLFSSGHVFKKPGIRVGSVTLELNRHFMNVDLNERQAEAILKTREMLWGTLDYYIHRDPKKRNTKENEIIANFKPKLLDLISDILKISQEKYVQSNSVNVFDTRKQ